MKFLSVLENIGAKFKIGVTKALALEAKALPAEEEVASAITVVDPALGGTLSGIVAVIANVEQIATAVGASTGTGQQKLAAALPAIEDAILKDPLFAGKSIKDLPTFNSAVETFASALVDILNVFESDTPAPAVLATAAPTQAAPSINQIKVPVLG